MLQRLVRINAGGKIFQTTWQTLQQFPNTSFAKIFNAEPKLSQSNSSLMSTGAAVSSSSDHSPPSMQLSEEAEIFIDVCPRVFERVLNFLRTKTIHLPTDDLSLRGDLIHQLRAWDLLDKAFPSTLSQEKEASDDLFEHDQGGIPSNTNEDENDNSLPLPDVCVVQLMDNMSVEAGVRRHALTITYGCDGFQLRALTQSIRKDLRPLLSSTYWQVHQTGERSVFFATTRVADGAASLLTTSIQQQVVDHTEAMGYTLMSSNVTVSPDPVHASVRILLQQFIFRRSRLHLLEPGDLDEEEAREELLRDRLGLEEEEVEETFVNMEPRHVGPKKTIWSSHGGGASSEAPQYPPENEKSEDFWSRNKS